MLETYGVPFPVDNSGVDTVDTEDTEESDWWNRGPGGTANRGPPPPGRVNGAPQASRLKNRVEYYPVNKQKKYKRWYTMQFWKFTLKN
jgi:hypothetical protein